MKKFVSILTLLAIITTLFPVTAFATKLPDIELDQYADLKEKFVEDMTQKIALDPELGDDFTISAIREMEDFSGNRYYLIECDPTGYMIYHMNSDTYAEYSFYAPSPYLDKKEPLFYGGMMEYYDYDDGEYTHTLTGETVESNSELYTAFQEQCDLINANMKESALQVATNTATANSTSIYGIVPRGGVLTNLNTDSALGQFVDGTGRGGNCGYVAAGLLMLYYDCVASDKFVDDAQYLNVEGDAFRGSSAGSTLGSGYNNLAKYLYVKYGNGNNSTYAESIKLILNRYYSNDAGISVQYETTYDLGGVFDAYTYLLTEKRPIIIFGSIYIPQEGEKKNHAVVGYGYAYDGTSYEVVVHYGYAGYSKVNVNNSSCAIGSTYRITDYTANDSCSRFTDIKYHWGKNTSVVV